MQMKAYCNGEVLLQEVTVADRFFPRLLGLMNKRSIAPSEGLLLYRCPQIHCLFMKFPIDVIYLSDDMKVLGIETVQPWHLGKRVPHTEHILELSAGQAKEKVSVGDCFLFDSLPYFFH